MSTTDHMVAMYLELRDLIEVAGYLSVGDVAAHFHIEDAGAYFLLNEYYRRNPDAARRESDRLINKARGAYY